MNLEQEFYRQINTLIQKGYPEIARIKTEDFLKLLEPLKKYIH